MDSARRSEAERLLPRGWPPALLGLAALFLVVLPLLDLLRTAVDAAADTGVSAVTRGTSQPVTNSLWTAAAAAAGAVLVGTAAAVVLRQARRRRLVAVAFLLPLLVPPFVSAIAWTRAFGPGGLSDDVAGVALPGLIGPTGIVAVMAVHATPVVFLIVSAALTSRARPEREWAARASGATAARAFTRVTLPLIAPAALGGGILAFVLSINSFGIPAVLGTPARFPTITTRIYSDLIRSSDPAAYSRVIALSLVLAVFVGLAVLAADRLSRAPTPPGAGFEPTLPGRRGGRGARVVWAYLAVTTFLPLAALLLTALTRAVGLSAWPSNWTLGNFREAWTAAAWPAARNTLVLAALAATLTSVLGLLLSLRARSKSGGGLGTLAAASFAVPGSVLAVAVLLAYGPWLRDTLAIILVAYLGKFWALAHRAIGGSSGAIEPDWIRASRASGATTARTLRSVVFPALRPAVFAAWLLVFLFGLHELTMSSLLHGPGTATLAVLTLDVQQLGDVTVTSALAVLLTVPALVAAAIAASRLRALP